MYCSSCGAAITKGVSYCNRCGAKVSTDQLDKASAVPAESLVRAMVSVFVLGIIATIGLLTMMKLVLNFQPMLILTFAVLSFLLIFIVEGVIIRLLLGRKSSAREPDAPSPSSEHNTTELEAPPARTLSESAPSITEHTTRNIEPLRVERESK